MTTDETKRGPLMLIRWADHFSRSAWHSRTDIDLEPCIIESIGWWAAEDDEMLVLHNGLSTDAACHAMSILQSAIVERWEVTL